MPAWVVLVASVAHAQPLSAFLDRAEEANVDRRLAREVSRRASADFASAWGSFLPTVNANGGYTSNQYKAEVTIRDATGAAQTITITPYDQLDATLKVELTVVDASKWLRAAASAASADAATLRERGTVEQVRRQVVSAYYAYVSAAAVLESATRSLEVSVAQREVTAARAKAGVANELELARADAEVERNNQAVADAQTLVDINARTLETVSGLEPRQVSPLPNDDLHPEPAEAEFAARLDVLPQVAAAEQDVVAANRTSTAATLALLPTVSAQYTQRFTNATGFQGANTLYNAGVNFAWRLDVPAVHTLRAQRSNAVTAELNAEKSHSTVRDQLHADWLRVRSALTKVKSAQAQVVSAKRASALAHERYAAGVATQLDVIQAERDVFSAELAHIQARGDLANARAALRLSAGLPVVAEESRTGHD